MRASVQCLSCLQSVYLTLRPFVGTVDWSKPEIPLKYLLGNHSKLLPKYPTVFRTRTKISETKYGVFSLAHHLPASFVVLLNCCLCCPFCHLFVVLVHFVTKKNTRNKMSSQAIVNRSMRRKGSGHVSVFYHS